MKCPALIELHGRNRRDRFCHGVNAKEIGELKRGLIVNGPVAHGIGENDLPAPVDQCNHSGNFPLVHVICGERRQSSQSLTIKTR